MKNLKTIALMDIIYDAFLIVYGIFFGVALREYLVEIFKSSTDPEDLIIDLVFYLPTVLLTIVWGVIHLIADIKCLKNPSLVEEYIKENNRSKIKKGSRLPAFVHFIILVLSVGGAFLCRDIERFLFIASFFVAVALVVVYFVTKSVRRIAVEIKRKELKQTQTQA